MDGNYCDIFTSYETVMAL